MVSTQEATDIIATGCTGNGTIVSAGVNPIVRRGFCYFESDLDVFFRDTDVLFGDTDDVLWNHAPCVDDDEVHEDTTEGIEGLVLSRVNDELVDVGYFTPTEVIDLRAVFTSRVSASFVSDAVDIYDDLYSYADLYALTNLYGIVEGQTSIGLDISLTNDDPAVDPEWGEWMSFIIGDYTARAYRFRIRATGTSPNITPIIYNVYIEVDMEDRIVSFEETVPKDGMQIDFDPAFYIAPVVGIAILDGQSGDYYTITGKDETGFYIEIFNGVTSVERTISGIARAYGSKET